MTMRHLTAALLAAALLTVAGCGGGNDSAELLSELKALRAEVQGLSDEVSSLKKQPVRAPKREARPTTALAPVATAGFPAKGSVNAPVTIVEFSDFQCPFCARHVKNTLPKIEENFVNTGKLRYVFMDNPIPSHRFAAKAAEAAHCAGDQGKYWEMHHQIFTSQHRIRESAFATFAGEIGLDATAFERCMTTGSHTERVQASRRQAGAVGARATPTFIIGKTRPDGQVVGDLIIGAKSYDSFAVAINRLLAQ
jgi:protein-disulfide isomerase